MKQNDKHISDDLLVRQLLGELNPEEQAKVTEWIAAKEENRRYYEHFRLIWQESRKLAAKSIVNEEEAWLRFQQKVQEKGNRPLATIPMPRKNPTWIRAAAILLVIVVCGGLIYYFTGQNSPKMLAIVSGKEVMTATLPDGSVVTLNKQSKLLYPESFKGNTRSVQLEGEAFFNIIHNKEKPFIIDANNTSVKVVGTSFNVKTSENRTEVIVETGIVEVSKRKNMVKLKPHEKATVLKGNDEPIKEQNNDELYSYYKTNEFVCDRTPLWRLADVLNDAYNVHIRIEGNIANRQITTTFRDRSLDEILAVIAETMGVQVEKNGTEIIIK